MKKRHIALVGLLAWSLTSLAQEKQVTILSVNDMHATIDQFPKLAAIADSLRALYPSLLILSAGDNCTGNPYSDRYKEPSYPMTALMNAVGFHASAMGNHEFDLKPEGFRRQASRSTFRYLCANLIAPDSLPMPVLPYQIFDCEGVRVGVLGVVQRGAQGTPDTHPDNVRGLRFLPEEETIRRYAGLRDSCEVAILLSHCGYEADQQWAEKFPFWDVIIGGHTHTKVAGNTFQGNVLITQAENKLRYATLTHLKLSDGKVVSKTSELIDVRAASHEQELATAMVDYFSHNEALAQVLTQVEADLTTYEELGTLMVDAYRAESGAEIALLNAGGVRYDNQPKGPMTVGDVLRLDPFGNESLLYQLTGKEVEQLVIECRAADGCGAPYVSGISYRLVADKTDPAQVKQLQIYDEAGRKLNRKKSYTVMVSSYVAAICPLLSDKPKQRLYTQTADLIIRFLSKQPTIHPKGAKHSVIY
ncbi:MAG: bifunctional UDP-sugar hydrolase/5'-nucleotidase [Parabacteroides sp.]|nr:bifunctional UDP-sugar hydrolase/5'-nucleotidase [Parabacteroides sp.]